MKFLIRSAASILFAINSHILVDAACDQQLNGQSKKDVLAFLNTAYDYSGIHGAFTLDTPQDAVIPTEDASKRLHEARLNQEDQGFKSIEKVVQVHGINCRHLKTLAGLLAETPLSPQDYARLHDMELDARVREFWHRLNEGKGEHPEPNQGEEKKADDIDPESQDPAAEAGGPVPDEESIRPTQPDADEVLSPGEGAGDESRTRSRRQMSQAPVGLSTLPPPTTTPAPTLSAPCGGQLHGATVITADTPVKTVRVNLNFMQAADGTSNYEEGDPVHDDIIRIAEEQTNAIYRTVASTTAGVGCNMMQQSRIQFRFTRTYIRDENLWDYDYNWYESSPGVWTEKVAWAQPTLSSNWPWSPLYKQMRDAEPCGETVIQVYFVNSRVNINLRRQVPQYFQGGINDNFWMNPMPPGMSLPNSIRHNQHAGGVAFYPQFANPYNPNRLHAIIMKNFFVGELFTSRVVPHPDHLSWWNPQWMSGAGIAQTLAHELGHGLWLSHYNSGSNCGTNLMRSSGFQRYLALWQINRMHIALTSSDLRSAVVPDHPELVISSPTTYDKYLRSHHNLIRIKAGASLTVTCDLEMPPLGRIIVERGGRLEVNRGGVIRSRCAHWIGVSVHGNAANPHPTASDVWDGTYPSSNPFAANTQHGVVVLSDGAMIENARHAVSLSRQNGHSLDLSSSGGIVLASDFTFLNCIRDIEFISYDFDNIATFENVEFMTDPTASTHFIPFEHLAHVTMWAVNGVQFKGCGFSNREANTGPTALFPPPKRATGLLIVHSTCTVTSGVGSNPPQSLLTVFTGLTNAILIEDATPYTVRPIVVEHTDFRNNFRGVDAEGKRNLIVRLSNFQIGSETSHLGPDFAFGIRCRRCDLLYIVDNFFTPYAGSVGSQFGVLSESSAAVEGVVYSNEFTELTTGLRARGSNPSLLFHCNTFLTTSGDVYLDRELASARTPGEVALNQLGGGLPANNRFTAPAAFVANGPGVTYAAHVFSDDFAAAKFEYYAPLSLLPASTYPTRFINTPQTVIPTNFPLACPPYEWDLEKTATVSKRLMEEDMTRQTQQEVSSLEKQVNSSGHLRTLGSKQNAKNVVVTAVIACAAAVGLLSVIVTVTVMIMRKRKPTESASVVDTELESVGPVKNLPQKVEVEESVVGTERQNPLSWQTTSMPITTVIQVSKRGFEPAVLADI